MQTPGPSAPPTGCGFGWLPVATMTASGLPCEHPLGAHLGLQHHLDPGLLHLLLLVADDDPELVAAGPLHGGAHLAAEGVAAIEQGDLMAAPAGHLGRPHAGRAAADHGDLLLHRGRFQAPLPPGLLAADGRVLHAADALVHADAADAPLVAGDAVAQIVQPPFLGLLGQVGVADQRPAHADHVGLAGGQHFFGHHRVIDAAGAEDRDLELLAHPGGERNGVAQGGVHGAFDQVEVVKGGDGEVHEIDQAAGLEGGADLLHLGEIETAGDHLVGAHAHAEGEVLADRLAHRLDEHQGRPQAVLQAAAELVLAVVGQGREELAGQARMAELQLDAVEAPLAHVLGAEGKIAGDLFDVLDLHRLGGLAEEDVGNRRGGPDRPAGETAVPLLAVVVELGEDLGVVLMDVVGDLLEPGDHLGVVDVDQLLVGHVGGMHRQFLGDDQTGPPLGAFAPVVHLALAGEVAHRQVGQVRLEGDAVLHLRPAEFEGRKQIREHHDWDSCLWSITTSMGCSGAIRPPIP